MECVLYIHIGRPEVNLFTSFPADNWIGGRLVARLLAGALRSAGEEEGSDGFGPLNDFVFAAIIANLDRAFEAVKTELEEEGIIGICQIGVAEGGSVRCLWPSSEVRMNWLVDIERLWVDHKRVCDQTAEALAALRTKNSENS